MSFAIDQISPEQALKILEMDETHFLDFKDKRITPSKMSKAVSAFANSSGGELYIGISEVGKTIPRVWAGFDSQEKANPQIAVISEMFSLGQYYVCTFLRSKKHPGLALHIEISKTPYVVKSTGGTPYVRTGAQSLPVDTPEKLMRLERNKGLTSFESKTVSVPLESVSNSVILLEFLINVVPSAEPDPWLQKQHLVSEAMPTVAAVLLYAELPQAALPKRCGIKVFRYETKDEFGTRETLSFTPITIEGCIVNQIKDAVDKTIELVEKIQVLTSKGLEPAEYPRETLHEIITNAVLHRDYGIISDIQIRIFDNRIEVESPGTLPGHVTPQNILSSQFARNGAIVRLANKFPEPPNKDVGEGLNTAFEAMKKLRLKEPLILEREDTVVVHIRHERLASPEESIMKYLESHDQINNRTARQLTGITSENKMKEVFYRLRDTKLLERVPDQNGSAAAWRKIPSE